MLRAILVALVLAAGATPLALSLASADEPVPVTPESTDLVYTELYLDDALLPGENGWFAVPFTVDRPAYVRVEMDTYEYTTGFTMAQGIVAIEGRESFPFMTFGGYPSQPILEVAQGGGSIVRCCDDVTTSWSMGNGEGSSPVLLSPGEVLWVGLAAFGWDEGHDAYFTVSAQALLSMGEPRAGTRVEAVDLYQDAMRQGIHVRAVGQQFTPVHGAAERVWTADDFGLMTVWGYSWGEGDARLTVELPGLAPVSAPVTQDGFYGSAHRAGTYRVALDEIHGPAVSQYDWMEARVFFADIDIPGDVAFVYPEPASA